MGNNWLAWCLTGLLVAGSLVAQPLASRAQERPDEGAPAVEEGAAPRAAEAGGDEPEKGETAGETSNGDSEPPDEEQPAEENAAAAADGSEADAAGPAEDAAGYPEGEEAGIPAAGAGTESGELPANVSPSADPALARDPVTGADDPLEYETEAAGEEGTEVKARDPLEGANRVFFHFNDFLDKALLKPTAQVYRFILPGYVRDRVRNVVNNADSPVILANDILQWKWKRAWHTTSRFFINTTLGVGGIWDVATSFGIERHTEDFGQTLCVWGVGEGFYLYLPFVGPTNPRDMTGKVVDRFFDPLTYYADVVQQIDLSDGIDIKFNVDRAGMAQLALTAADLIDMRARNIETINEIERTSIDFYTAVRSLYRQSRDSACRDGQVDFEDLPDLSDEFE